MKYGKKLASLLLAAAIAVPMTLASINADESNDKEIKAGIPFTKTDEAGNKLAGATVEFYKETQLLFKATTREDGKLNPSDAPKYINEKGELMLKNGDYSYREVKSPSNYMLNTDINKFYVIGDVADPINLENKKIPEGKGQIIIKAIDKKNRNGLEGAEIEIYSKKNGTKNDIVATLNTDSNGNVISSFSQGVADSGIEPVGSGIAINPGTYYIKENKAPQGYYLADKELKIVVNKASQSTVTIEHTLNDGKKPNQQVRETGVKIKGINITTNKPMPGLEVAIYMYDNNGKLVEKEIFIGKTGSDGYISSSSLRSNLLSKGVVYLKPGKYVAKLYRLKNAKSHEFTVVKDKVTPLELKTKTISTGLKPGARKSSPLTKSKRATLAKTGSKNTRALSVLGLGIVAAGVFLVRKK